MLGLTAPCRHFFSCRAARASASRAPTDTVTRNLKTFGIPLARDFDLGPQSNA